MNEIVQAGEMARDTSVFVVNTRSLSSDFIMSVDLNLIYYKITALDTEYY